MTQTSSSFNSDSKMFVCEIHGRASLRAGAERPEIIPQKPQNGEKHDVDSAVSFSTL